MMEHIIIQNFQNTRSLEDDINQTGPEDCERATPDCRFVPDSRNNIIQENIDCSLEKN